MPWSELQVRTVREATFRPSLRGYHPDDVERLRERVLIAMENGQPLDDMDAMALRRVPGMGASTAQVDGLRTLLAVWRKTTPIEDPLQAAMREREEAAAAFGLNEDDTTLRWTSAQIDLVRDKTFTRVGRASTAYAEGDVNDYLHEVVAAMRKGLEIPDPQYARFDSAGMRRGYDPREVDDFLDELAQMQPQG